MTEPDQIIATTPALDRTNLLGLTRAQLEGFFLDIGEKRFRAQQVMKWIHHRGVRDFAVMTDLSQPLRARLSEIAAIVPPEIAEQHDSRDGTRKWAIALEGGSLVEAVLIPDGDRATLCVSSQVGCTLDCSFCSTGKQGFQRDLTAAEIIGQVWLAINSYDAWQAGKGRVVTNVVMMGMGEPLHNLDNLIHSIRTMLDDEGLNLSHRKVTVSTVGLVPAMKKLQSALPVNIAVSLNASSEEQRLEVMPITKRYSMEELLSTCRDLPLHKSKRITFEYVMMAGFNDSMEDAARLIHLMRGIKSKINLIPYNENPARDIRRPSASRVKDFQHYLVSRGVHCSVRATRGKDISAACGQLGKAKQEEAKALGA